MLMATVTASVFAQDENVKSETKWNGQINKVGLSRYLKLDYDQHKEVSDICDYFEEQMRIANSSKKNKDAKLRKAVYGNLKLMKQTLDDDQYRSYLRLMACTLRNKGIDLTKQN